MSKICVLIHGYLSDFRDFTVLPGRIIKDYDQIIMLNLPGHQDGQIKNFIKKNVFDYLDNEMNKIIKDRNGNKNIIDVIGFSLGGALTWYLAHHYELNKIVLLSPAIYYLNFNLYFDRRKYLKSLKNLSEEEKQKAKANYKKRNKEAFRFAKENTISKFRIKNAIEFIKIINKVKKEQNDIDVPMLLVRGNLDELVSKKSVNVCLKHNINPIKEVYLIEDIGHMMLRTDRADEIIYKIIEFLEDNSYESNRTKNQISS